LIKLILSLILVCSFAAQALTSSTSTKLNIFGMWISTNSNCSNPTEIFNSVTSTQYDMFTNPTFGANSSITTGTYKCLIIKMSDQITFTPAATQGSCTIGVPATIDVCMASNTINTSVDLAGTTINCVDNTDDTVFVYVSVDSYCADSISDVRCDGTTTYPNAFLPPTAADDDQRGVKLASNIVLTASTTATFVFDTTSKVDGTGGTCNLEPPVMSIR
jgi:hypothetical protein